MWPPQYCLCKAWQRPATIFFECRQRAEQGAKQAMIDSSQWFLIWPRRFTSQLILLFCSVLDGRNRAIRVVVGHCLICQNQSWASPPRVARGGTLWPALITLDLQFWSHRPHNSLHFCWTMLYYSMHFHWLAQSCVYLMLCLPQKYLDVFFPID